MLYLGRRRWKSHVVVVLVLVTAGVVLWNVLTADKAELPDDARKELGRLFKHVKKRQAMGMAQISHMSRYWGANGMGERLERMEKMCGKRRSSGAQRVLYDISTVQHHMLLAHTKPFMHCTAPHAASTFWKRFVKMLNDERRATDDVTRDAPTTTSSSRLTLERGLQRVKMAAFITSSFRSVFVRSPHSRMLSFYVDNVFSPNPTFWKLWGRKAVRLSRKNADVRSLRCGHDATFAEVLSYAMRSKNSDFQPVSLLCQPCAFHYNFIGKMETFAEDVALLTKRLHLPYSLVFYYQSAQFGLDYAQASIEASVNAAFSRMAEISACMSMHEAGLRIWRQLQIKGLVSRKLHLPFNEFEFHLVTAAEMVRAAVEAHLRSVSEEDLNEGLKEQRREALVEAFSSVRNSTLVAQWENSQQEDFSLFGYSSHPPQIFHDNPAAPIPGGAFDWRREWRDANDRDNGNDGG